MAKFPYTSKDDKAVERGDQIQRARYFQGIRTDAQDIIAESLSDGEVDEDLMSDLVHQTADNRVIYTRDCLMILLYSDNWTAIEDAGMDLSSDFTQVICQAAYFAYQQDLMEMIQAQME